MSSLVSMTNTISVEEMITSSKNTIISIHNVIN